MSEIAESILRKLVGATDEGVTWTALINHQLMVDSRVSLTDEEVSYLAPLLPDPNEEIGDED